MRVGNRHFRTIWQETDGVVRIIDQTRLPFRFVILALSDVEACAEAIGSMRVRGAPLIGATAAYGIALACRADPTDVGLARAHERLLRTRPTAVNLRWALGEVMRALRKVSPAERAATAARAAATIADADVETNNRIGEHGEDLLQGSYASKRSPGERLNVLTHCNAGWLATVDWGTALAPIYKAHAAGLPVHLWVDETRPRNQGASLTAWELLQEGVPHTVIADNAGGHLMQRDLIDLCVVGSDRTTRRGDVCNKIGTYLKALAARDTGVPFYVALPGSTIDWTIEDGLRDIPIEQRSAAEVTRISGQADDGRIVSIQLTPDGSPARNDAFDVTPARLVSGLITERGTCEASEEGLLQLYPERA